MPQPLHLSALESFRASFAASSSPRRLFGRMAGAVSAAAISLSVLTISPADCGHGGLQHACGKHRN